MGGFQDLEQAIDPSRALNPDILPEDTAFAEEELDDVTALQIVLNDASESISYLQSHNLMPSGVDKADELVKGTVKPRQWADGKPRSNMPMFQVLEAIEKILPVLHMALFGSGKRRPFNVSPLGKTTPDAARAKGAVLAWAMKQAGVKEEMRRTLKTVLTYGFVVGWWGWESKKHRKKVYTKDAEGKVTGKWKEELYNLPTYECLDLKNVLVDPKCRRQDIRKGAGYVIKQVMITANDLQSMRDDTETYQNIPTDEELRFILAHRDEPTEDTLATNKRAVWREFQAKLESEKSSIDPLQQPLEYLEYWTTDRVIGVLQRKIVIRNEANEDAVIPGVSCAFVDILGSAWGFGVARLLSSEQRLQAGVLNNWVDGLALVLNPVYQLLKGIGPGTQNIQVSPGKVITESGELKPLITPDVTGPAMNAVASSEERAAKRVGANGGTNLPTQALRTGTGVDSLQGDVTQRLQYFLEIFIDLIYVPVLEAFVRLCADHLTPDQINAILTIQQGKAWEGDILDVYNAECSIEVLAGTNLIGKAALAQLAPMITALVTSGPAQESFQIAGEKFNMAEYIKQTLDIQGVPIENLVIPMTAEDQARADAMNQAQAKGMADARLQAQKHQDDLESINEKGTVQAGVSIVKQAAKTHLDVAANEVEKLSSGGGQ
jgi:hypothetical protein